MNTHRTAPLPLAAPALVLALLVTSSTTASALAQRGDPPDRPAPQGGRGAPGRGAASEHKAADAEPGMARLPDEAGWRDMIANDARVSFTQRTAGEARAVLDAAEAADATEERRAIAMVGLGAAGAVIERTRLERVARSGTDLERRAAVLALGELAAATDALLEEWIAKAEPPVAECALLALLRSGSPAGRRRVEEIAADPSQRLAPAAADLLVFAADRSASRPTRAAVLLMRLRFDAARMWGLVDGETWEGLAVRKLANDPEFVRDFVLSAAPTLHGAAARDHVFVELQRGTGFARLRAAVAILPAEVSDLVDSGLWRPADANEWTVMLDEIGARRLERLTLPFLRAAMGVELVSAHAMALLAWAGDEDAAPLLAADTAHMSDEDRVWISIAVGGRKEGALLERFAELGKSDSPRVRMAWLVAQFRQKVRTAATQVEATLTDAETPGHRPLVLALCNAARDPAVAAVLEDWLPSAPEEEAALAAIALGIEGRIGAHAKVRDVLSVEPPPQGLLAVRLVRALRRQPTPEDLNVLRRLFPSATGDRALDRELALALLERNEPEVMPILRAALWGSDGDLSLLAGGLIVGEGGVNALLDELRVPPTSATSGDLRRVGFAIGEWGGVAAVNLLARELRWASGEAALQGALLGMLSTRTQ
jgi:hypothetical protein